MPSSTMLRRSSDGEPGKEADPVKRLYVTGEHWGNLLMAYYRMFPRTEALALMSRQQAFAIFRDSEQYGAFIEQVLACEQGLTEQPIVKMPSLP